MEQSILKDGKRELLEKLNQSISINIIKKDGTKEAYNTEKIKGAINKAAERVLVTLSDEEIMELCVDIYCSVVAKKEDSITVQEMHNLVEASLSKFNTDVAESYRNYRNYKQDFVHMLDKVYQESQRIMYLGDKSNANADSSLVTTKRSLMFGELSKELYKKFFLNTDELSAVKDGYIYIHDISSRLLTSNCCIADISTILKGGFELANVWYNEPKSLDVAFGVISDITLSASGCQYGGFSIGEIDKLLEPYAEMSYKKQLKAYIDLGVSFEKAEAKAWNDLERMAEQGFQSWEMKWNTLSSARGDFSFISTSFGLGTSKISKMLSKKIMEVRARGEGKDGNRKPVLFPKLIFLYDEEVHGIGKELEEVFEAAVECNKKSMYPDYISLSGPNYVGKMFQQHRTPITAMGCRSFLSPWYIEGGMRPANEEDTPIFVGRGNIGVISLNMPMIYAKAKHECKDFFEVLDYYLEMVRHLHLKTRDYLGNMKASCNPLMYMEGGFYKGHLQADDCIAPVLESFTTSFGVTALNELNVLHNGKTIAEDGEFPLQVMKHMNEMVDKFKEEDKVLHSIYYAPAESLCHTQVNQFKEKYGIIKGVSDKEYMTNGFHCHVSEDIDQVTKQDLEERFLDTGKGGQIFFNRFDCDYNTESFKILIRRAMKKGFYFGTNLRLSYCEDCGYEGIDLKECPHCGSTSVSVISRVCGYLGWEKVKGDTRYNTGKYAETQDRKSY